VGGKALRDFAESVPQADTCLQECQECLSRFPVRLRRSPEDRDAAEAEVKREGAVKDVHRVDITFKRLSEVTNDRQAAARDLGNAKRAALTAFAAFLLSPRVRDVLTKEPAEGLQEILQSKSADQLAKAILAMTPQQRKALAKALKVMLGGKTQKTVRLSAFSPKTDVVWEPGDVDIVTKEFREYLRQQLAQGTYLKIER